MINTDFSPQQSVFAAKIRGASNSNIDTVCDLCNNVDGLNFDSRIRSLTIDEGCSGLVKTFLQNRSFSLRKNLQTIQKVGLADPDEAWDKPGTAVGHAWDKDGTKHLDFVRKRLWIIGLRTLLGLPLSHDQAAFSGSKVRIFAKFDVISGLTKA